MGKRLMKDKKQFWKGMAAGFVLTLLLVEGAILGNRILGNMLHRGKLDLTSSETEKSWKRFRS